MLGPVFTSTLVCPTGKLSKPRRVLDYHTVPVSKTAFFYLNVAKRLQPFLLEQESLLSSVNYVMLKVLESTASGDTL